MSIKIQSAKVLKITKQYLKALRMRKAREEGYLSLNEALSEQAIFDIDRSIILVESTLEAVSNDTAFFIRNEYINHNDYNWWQEYYSRSSYYRHKQDAINDFLHCYQLFLND